MSEQLNLVYLYDGSFDGLLSAIFDAYARHERPVAIAQEGNLQVTFGQQVFRVDCRDEKARRVEAGIIGKMGSPSYQKIWKAYLSGDPDKATVIYQYVRRGLQIGRKVYNDIAHPHVLRVEKLASLVAREAHLLTEFLRFALMEGGVYYARISPEHYVVPLLMPHFVDRYCVQPFLIHDTVHNVAGIYDMREWRMVETTGLTLPDESYDELCFKRMWKKFYETIAIRERRNPKCQRNHMPKKYWQNMAEHSFVETPKTRAMDAAAAQGLVSGVK